MDNVVNDSPAARLQARRGRVFFLTRRPEGGLRPGHLAHLAVGELQNSRRNYHLQFMPRLR